MMQTFPFTAIVGHESLKLALLLNAIDHRIGGVVISGPRGSAKTTLSRALADVADIPIEQFVTLPLGATEERVVGTLDVEKILQKGELKFSPGILHQAHEGILYVDEVNLLADPIVDLLLDVAASGVNVIERDGLSKRHPSRFVLIGTMNPDEGELRPQLLDRFGLCVELSDQLDLDQRMQVVERRIAFDNNPAEFLFRYQEQQDQIKEKIKDARLNLSNVSAGNECKRYICELCQRSQVDGVRADITLLRTAMAYAAWLGVQQLEESMVDVVAEFVLCHRRKVDASITKSIETKQDRANSPGQVNAQNRLEQAIDQDSLQGESQTQGSFGELPPVSVATGAPRNIKSVLATTSSDGLKKKVINARARLNPAGSRRNFTNLALEQQHNKNFLTPQRGKLGTISWHSSLLNSVNKLAQGQPRLPVRLCDIVRRQRSSKTHHLNMILLDTSASTLGSAALQQAKALVQEINDAAYLNRDRIALMSFGNDQVKMLIPPTRPLKKLRNVLDDIKAAGGTPLRKGLMQASYFLERRQRIETNERATLFIITDGRSNDNISDINIGTNIGTTVVLIDMEAGEIRLNRGRILSQQLNAKYVHVDDIPFTEGQFVAQ